MPEFHQVFHSVKDVDQKMKFEHLLAKKCKEYEKLAAALVQCETQVLQKLKQK